MAEVTQAKPSEPPLKRRSIKTKILLALLTLSLLPLILTVAINRARMTDVQEYVKSRLVREAQKDLLRVAVRQAGTAEAILDNVERQTRTVAFLTEAVLRNPTAFDAEPAAGQPHDPVAGSYSLPPRLTLAAAKPELDLTSNLDKLFAFIQQGDPILETIYFGTKSGVYRQYPADRENPTGSPEFTLDRSLAQGLNRPGEIAQPVRRALTASGMALSRHATVSTTEPGNNWIIQDDESKRIFSVRQGDIGLVVKEGYDPTIRPWYLSAVGRETVVWAKYPDWDLVRTGGRPMFAIGKDFNEPITGKVTPALASAFRSQQVVLSVNSPIAIEQGSKWIVQDENGNNYDIRKDNDTLNVYQIDVLTCSKAVFDPEGNLAGVVGLDVSLDTVSGKVIRTPDGFKGYAFLLNGVGRLIDQEKADMFIPEVGGDVRSRMVAGDTGAAYDVASANYVAYAPIRAVHTRDGKKTWSVGVSMPEHEITELADEIHKKLVAVLELVLGLFAILIAVVVFGATRISKGITGPIVALDAGVKRIGSGDLDYRVKVETRDEIGELAGAFNKMAGDVQAYIKNLRETTAEKERFESELRVAHDIQMSFLKKIFPAFPNRDEFSLYAAIKPAREVGGDLYDFALLDDSRVFFYIGDVSDKGVPASLIMAITMTLMKRASLQPGITPAGILSQVNATLSEGNENVMFVTLFIGILNFRAGELAFSNAGHNPPVILSANGDCKFLDLPDGIVLGVMPEAQYFDATVVLERGDAIVTYTDGVTEAMNNTKELYSELRLRETVEGLSGRSVEDLVAAIFASVKAHAAGAPQSDDIAVLAVQRS